MMCHCEPRSCNWTSSCRLRHRLLHPRQSAGTSRAALGRLMIQLQSRRRDSAGRQQLGRTCLLQGQRRNKDHESVGSFRSSFFQLHLMHMGGKSACASIVCRQCSAMPATHFAGYQAFNCDVSLLRGQRTNAWAAVQSIPVKAVALTPLTLDLQLGASRDGNVVIQLVVQHDLSSRGANGPGNLKDVGVVPPTRVHFTSASGGVAACGGRGAGR
jgi:hypothetical protein